MGASAGAQDQTGRVILVNCCIKRLLRFTAVPEMVRMSKSEDILTFVPGLHGWGFIVELAGLFCSRSSVHVTATT